MTTTAYEARQKLLSLSDEVIDAYADVCLGRDGAKKFTGDATQLANLFNKLVPMMRIDDDRQPVEAFKAETTEDRIQGIFDGVASGAMSLDQGLVALDILTAGSNVIEAQELREALQRMGA